MKDRKAKMATAATVVGLAALGGAALGSNHGQTTGAVASASNSGSPIVTGASGSTASTHGSAVTAEGHRTPIVTRSSTTAGGAPTTDD